MRKHAILLCKRLTALPFGVLKGDVGNAYNIIRWWERL